MSIGKYRQPSTPQPIDRKLACDSPPPPRASTPSHPPQMHQSLRVTPTQPKQAHTPRLTHTAKPASQSRGHTPKKQGILVTQYLQWRTQRPPH